MHESRSITAVIIGIVSLTLIGAAWFFLARNPRSAASGPKPARRSDPYSSYYRDMGQIADSLSTPPPAPAAAPAGGAANAPLQPAPGVPGQPLPPQPAASGPGAAAGSAPFVAPNPVPPSPSATTR